MKTDYKGIDYSLGFANHDGKFHFGVINQNDVGQVWCDESEPYYVYLCPECGHDFGNDAFDICPECDYHMHDNDYDLLEPISYYYSNDEYEAECGTDTFDIFVTKSPYFTYAQFCSPCAPGAVYLMNYMDKSDDNPQGYCFGHDWFEDGKAPYPVYSVETGEEVLSEKEHG